VNSRPPLSHQRCDYCGYAKEAGGNIHIDDDRCGPLGFHGNALGPRRRSPKGLRKAPSINSNQPAVHWSIGPPLGVLEPLLVAPRRSRLSPLLWTEGRHGDCGVSDALVA
jgi:hypothetical protein